MATKKGQVNLDLNHLMQRIKFQDIILPIEKEWDIKMMISYMVKTLTKGFLKNQLKLK